MTQSDDPRSFRQGVDLLNEHGLPWQIPLAGIADSAHHQILLKILARDALVSPEVMTKAASLSKDFIRKNRRSLGPNAQVVHELFEPFYVNLAKPDGAVFVVGDETIFSALTRELFSVDN
ncbi:hypothetical protein BN946_scf184720.g2 [Trametes cinnabarina]|uniref:Uncharacterized protein n=1 Tax=Pycnoporus cinnabarinus TaxID=5643 RepID=A0A060SZG4_PYCCI|nr:hypothetical protein BN946_scf184720.g2 [Trametes cinnabarina]